MKTRAVILAGGEGSRLGILTDKRTKPAVPFAGKYRIIDFTLSNCVNSGIFDVMILAQYRPHSLIEHIGPGGPWDLNRDFTGGVRILSPYLARGSSDWYLGTADAVQQNFRFIKSGSPDLILILSGDHIYKMDYSAMIDFHLKNQVELTIASIRVPDEDASRFGILGVDDNNRVTSFVEKPDHPPSNLANMGVYLFSRSTLDHALWDDRTLNESSHDFGKDILPRLVSGDRRIFTYPFDRYWVDVGTITSYWQAHMDLLTENPPINLNDRQWIIHTRTEERPPVRIAAGAVILDSMITDGSVIEGGARIERCVLSPGVYVGSGAVIRDSIILTDAVIESGALVEATVVEKRVRVGENARVGGLAEGGTPSITMIGKKSVLPAGIVIEPGAIIGTDVVPEDFVSLIVRSGDYIQTKRQPYEV
jgi:glucose-1-phosphate adenylyltransferase